MVRLLSLLLLSACTSPSGTEDDSASLDTGASGASGACALAEEYSGCDDCIDGDVACSFGDLTVVAEDSCGSCDGLQDLYRTLCAQGSEASRQELEAGTVCEDVD